MNKETMLKNENHSGLLKSKAILVSLLLITCVTVGGTLAYIVADSKPVENTFTPSVVTTEVMEDVTTVPGTKSDVKIKNTGDTTAYIRAAVVVTWQDEAGNVLGEKPVERTDYSITYDLKNGWVQGADGFYYWTSPVLSYDENSNDCYTGVLFTDCTPVEGRAPEGYSLAVEILGSGIQSVPDTAVEEAWSNAKVTVDANNGTLTVANEVTNN